MTFLSARTFLDRWPLFVGTVLATAIGVAIVHAGMTIILGIEEVVLPPDVAPSEADSYHQLLSGASTLTGMTVILGAFLTVFVVGSTFGFAVEQRRHDLAVLRLGGVTARQLRRLLLAEALIVAILGAVSGALLGFVLTALQKGLLAFLGTFPPGVETPLQPMVLILDVVAAGVVCVLGVRGASRRATNISPLDALRRTGNEEKAMTARRWVVAGIAGLLTAVQIFFSATTRGMLIPLLLGLGIVITASVAINQLAPLLVPAVARTLMPAARRSPTIELAVSNLRDAVRRTASCAAPMIVLVSLVMGLQGILDTQTKAAETETTMLLNADLVASGDSLDLNAIDNIDGISLAAPETVVPFAIHLTQGSTSLTGPGTVVAVDPEAFRATHLQKPDSGDLAEFDSGSVVFGPGLDSTIVRGHYDDISLTTSEESWVLDEAARMGETLAGTDGFYIDRSILPADALEYPTSVLIQIETDADLAAIKEDLGSAGADTVRSPSEISQDQSLNASNENRAVMAAIVGLGSVYALISVLSTLAIAIGQRKREFATLRLSGLSRRQIVTVTVIEALSSIAIGLVLGAIAAIVALIGLWIATARVYGVPVVAIPWSLLGMVSLVVTVLTTATVVLATRRATVSPPIRAIGEPA